MSNGGKKKRRRKKENVKVCIIAAAVAAYLDRPVEEVKVVRMRTVSDQWKMAGRKGLFLSRK